MNGNNLSLHAERRMRQRGIPEANIDFVVKCGTPLDDGAFFLSQADVYREINLRKQEIQLLEKLKNCKVVVRGDAVLTAYRPTGKKLKRTLRRLRDGEE